MGVLQMVSRPAGLVAEREARRADVAHSVERAAAAIRSSEALALACHVSPDGDALGSMLALFHLARDNGHSVVCSWPSPFTVGPHYEFLPGLADAVPPRDFPRSPELMITFDLGRFERLGDLEPAAHDARELLVLDHHEDNRRFGTLNVVDLDAAATAVVVRDLARELGWDLDFDAAVCLYTGLVTDTGRFRYPNTTPAVFRLAEELAELDIPISHIEWELFEKHRFAYLRLVGSALERARLEAHDGFVATWCTTADLEQFGVAFDETEGLIDVLRQAAEAEVSCVIREVPADGALHQRSADGPPVSGVMKVSLRSTGALDVGALARRYGGGGHWFMAGFTSHDPVDDIIDALHREVHGLRQAAASTDRTDRIDLATDEASPG